MGPSRRIPCLGNRDGRVWAIPNRSRTLATVVRVGSPGRRLLGGALAKGLVSRTSPRSGHWSSARREKRGSGRYSLADRTGHPHSVDGRCTHLRHVDLDCRVVVEMARRPSNKEMKLTRLSAAPGWFREHQAEGAASCPRRRGTAGTASQLMRSVLRTPRA